ncbi:MAG: putative thioesterase [Bacteroidia bacterium]|jgi:predicted thioesterase|tara:strand:- start:3951 stop:4349 length:399 start_codon:yes stop_codon:yes gene_type:complete
MKQLFRYGDTKEFYRTVGKKDAASFNGVQVHPYYSTYALARDAEWTSRLFVLDMKEAEEEGIGTFVDIKHKSPAPIGSEVRFIATLKSVIYGEVVCTVTAKVGMRLIATIETGQKILTEDELESLKRVAHSG